MDKIIQNNTPDSNKIGSDIRNNVSNYNQPTNNSNKTTNTIKENQYNISNRLNALDSELLENNAYRDLNDENFKLEYRIEQLEKELIYLNNELKTSKEINDILKIDSINLKKHSVEKELENLYQRYKGNNLSKKITDTITRPRKNILEVIINLSVNFIENKILPKFSQRFNSGLKLKQALGKLENINRNVDELVSLNTPYGETEEKYERLTNYLSKASSIQYNVSKSLSNKDSKIKTNPFAEMTSKEKATEKAKKLLMLNKKKDLAQKNALNLNNNLNS